jgi:hypothetical protein
MRYFSIFTHLAGRARIALVAVTVVLLLFTVGAIIFFLLTPTRKRGNPFYDTYTYLMACAFELYSFSFMFFGIKLYLRDRKQRDPSDSTSRWSLVAVPVLVSLCFFARVFAVRACRPGSRDLGPRPVPRLASTSSSYSSSSSSSSVPSSPLIDCYGVDCAL